MKKLIQISALLTLSTVLFSCTTTTMTTESNPTFREDSQRSLMHSQRRSIHSNHKNCILK